jgi:hypothetical protein
VAFYGHGRYYETFFKEIKVQYAKEDIVELNFPYYGAALNIDKWVNKWPETKPISEIPLNTLVLYQTRHHDAPIFKTHHILKHYSVQQHFGKSYRSVYLSESLNRLGFKTSIVSRAKSERISSTAQLFLTISLREKVEVAFWTERS